MGFLKGAGKIVREFGGAFIGSRQKPENKSGIAKANFYGRTKPENAAGQKPKNQSVLGAIFGSGPKRPAAEKQKEKPKDDSVFAGEKSWAKRNDIQNWLKANKNKIYGVTKGRVGESELKEFGGKLIKDPIVKKQDWGQYGRKEILKRLEDESQKAKNKYDAREDIQVAKKMFGLDEKK